MDKIAVKPFVTPLKRIFNPKGDIFHVMKKSDPGFAGFGEAYFSTVDYLEVKGWKKHSLMLMNLVVPMGEVCFYLYDEFSRCTTQHVLGPANYGRLTVPPGYWMAFAGRGREFNLVLNLASIEHDPKEAINAPLDSYPLEMLT